MKSYYAYIRVSTVKQGEKGSSLQEQRSAIESLAQRREFRIAEWFEEKETAAKRGRPVFNRMLKLLRANRAQGVIIHKIDRSARNLRDWADINELIDSGVEIHLAHENIDLHSRGGRLSADIQAVVAADFIRNLREETRKGVRGRLKQGLYPLPAPVGYLDQGPGMPKIPDPLAGPLVRRAFDLYATGRYNLETLGTELFRLGLRNRRGNRVTRNGLSGILNREFYVGIIRMRGTGEYYQGNHQPLIPKSLFDRVQAMLHGKLRSRGWKHDFLYRRILLCVHCRKPLTGESQKGHVYYRCHTASCPRKAHREEVLNDHMKRALGELELTPQELVVLRAHLWRYEETKDARQKDKEQAITLALSQLDDRMNRLTDALIDGLIDKTTFEERKRGLLDDRAAIIERRDPPNDEASSRRTAEGKFELIRSLSLSDSPTNPEETLELLRSASSNLTVDGKYVVVDWDSPFREVAAREEFIYGVPEQDHVRRTSEDAPVAQESPQERVPRVGWAHEWCEAILRGM